MTPINLAQKLELFDDRWQPKIVGRFNGHDLMVVKVQGEFVWHAHQDTDDFFLVLKGALTIDMPENRVQLLPGELFVVPRGVTHRPRADVETHILLIEPCGESNTGNVETAAVKLDI